MGGGRGPGCDGHLRNRGSGLYQTRKQSRHQKHRDFADFPGAFPVQVVEAVPDKRIVLRWESAEERGPDEEANHTTVTMEFEPVDDGRTLVTISEEGWRASESGLQASYGNCEGWTGALCAMKAWVEYRINLREGFYA